MPLPVSLPLITKRREARIIVAKLTGLAHYADLSAEEYALDGDFASADCFRARATAYAHAATLVAASLGIPTPPS